MFTSLSRYHKKGIFCPTVDPFVQTHASPQAYKLSTLTGTQVLLLVVSETGLVYTFTTAKLRPLVTQPEGKNLIQACLNTPHGSLPSSMPVGTPIGRSSAQMSMSSLTSPANNIPGGISIGGGAPGAGPPKGDDGDGEEEDVGHGVRPKAGDKRRRRGSASTNPANASANSCGGGPTSPHSPNVSIHPRPLRSPDMRSQRLHCACCFYCIITMGIDESSM
jgi:pheromone receptor transcription factor